MRTHTDIGLMNSIKEFQTLDDNSPRNHGDLLKNNS